MTKLSSLARTRWLQETRRSKQRDFYLAQHGSAAGLNGLNLGHLHRGATEAGRKLRDVEEDAGSRLHGTKLSTRGATDAASSDTDRLLERTVLLGVVAVGAEGAVGGGGRSEALGELASRRGRVRLGGVVDVGCELGSKLLAKRETASHLG